MLSRLSIKNKITFGFGIILLLMLCGGGIAMLALQDLGTSSAAVEVRNKEANASRDIDRAFLELRFATTEFAAKGTEEAKSAAEVALIRAQAAVGTSASLIVEPHRREVAGKIASLLTEYMAAWNDLAALKLEQITLIDKAIKPALDLIRNRASFLQTKLTALGDDSLMPIAYKVVEMAGVARVAAVSIVAFADQTALARQTRRSPASSSASNSWPASLPVPRRNRPSSSSASSSPISRKPISVRPSSPPVWRRSPARRWRRRRSRSPI